MAGIKAKYEQFMKAEFNVDGAIGHVGVRPESFKSLDVAITYNEMLWAKHHEMHLTQLETMHNVGDISKMSFGEAMKYIPSTTEYVDGQ